MRTVTYVGRYQRVEVEVAPRRWVTVRHGDPVELPDSIADRLLEQSVWTEPAVAAVPDGKAADILAWVDGDPDRAAQALTAEQNGKARKGLLADLRQIAGTTADDTDHTGADSTEEG